MPTIKVFEGPMCCNTGVCGLSPAQALVDFTADARWVTDQGASLTRANLAQDPAAFAADDTARAFVRVAGVDALPLVTVDGITVLTGRYPTRPELARYAGIAAPQAMEAGAACCEDGPVASGCCAPAPQLLQIDASARSCC